MVFAQEAPELDEELSRLTPNQRLQVEKEWALRERAARLAGELELDQSDVYHQLKQLARTPTDRLRRGLIHGRRRPRIS